MEIQTNSKIGEIIRKAETDFISGTTQTSKYVSESLYEDIQKIEAYLNSKHISGETDSLGREKPFFNIVLAARNIWFRATDLDRKDIRIKPTKRQEYIPSFLATLHLQDWMRRTNFGKFLNDWGITLAGYKDCVVKFVEKEGQLYSMVIPWTRIICDQIDFASNPKIEILELTPAQLRKREGYDQDIVDKLIDTRTARESTDKLRKDNKNDYIKLYEIHGELPLSYLTGNEEDEEKYVQQMHVVSFVAGKENGEYDDFTLVSGKESQDPYILTSLLPEIDGSVTLNGSVKNLFEAQWMMNHTVKAIKDQLDLASKLIFQTSDGNFVGQNALSAIESGDILIHKPQEPLTQLANSSHDIASLQAFGNQWKVQAQEIVSTPDVLMGNNMPSGTAYRQAAIIQQQSLSNFEIMTENKGLAIEEILRNFIIPFLKKKMDTSEEISATLEGSDLAMVDRAYISYKATKDINEKNIETALQGEIPDEVDFQGEMARVQGELSATGNQRFFKPSEIPDKTWNEVLKDLEWEVEVNITGESSNTQVVMETLTNVLQTVAGNPAILQDPNMKLLFNKILTETQVISPMELNSTIAPQIQTQQNTNG